MSPLPKAAWSEVSMDFAELPNSEYLLIITDDYSRYPVVETVKSASANTVIPRVDNVFSEFGIPDVVKTDKTDPLSTAVNFSRLCRLLFSSIERSLLDGQEQKAKSSDL